MGSVLASLTIVFTAALLLQLTTGALGRGAWLGTTIGLSFLASLLPGRPPRLPEAPKASAVPGWLKVVLLAAAGMALAVVSYRAVEQPLTGPDTIFRWDFLARQILRQGGIGFYPQASDADFTHYMWADGIPPLLSLLYAWSYMGAGSAAPALTAPIVLIAAGLGFMLASMLATRIAGPAAGLWALALLAGSAVNTWSVSMGQETGLTTLALLALAWALGSGESGPDWRLAALAASVAALSRDYCLALVVAGLAFLAFRRRPVRELVGYGAVTTLLVAPWYLRNWARTGNPLFNIDVLGLFPVDRTHADMMQSYVARYGFGGHLAARLGELAPLMWPLGAGVLIAALAASRVRGAWPPVLWSLGALWLALWAWSVGYTAGGIGYSLRVLSPLLAIMAVAGGVALSSARTAWKGALAALLLVAAGEASARALLMMRMPASVPVADWLAVGKYYSAGNGTPSHDSAAAIIGNGRVMVDDAYTHAYLVNRGVGVVPLWSPGLDFLRAPNVNMAEAVGRLRERGITYIWLTAAPEPRDYFDQFSFFRQLDPWLVPKLSGQNWVLFALKPPDAAGK